MIWLPASQPEYSMEGNMNPPVENLLHRTGIEFLTLDENLRITGMSVGAARLADDPSSVQIGSDVRCTFPELVGIEDDLIAVREGRRDAYVIRGFCRHRTSSTPLYVTVRVELHCDGEAAKRGLIVIVEDVTHWMTEIQQRTQTSNEALLLLQALSASKDHIENIFDAMAELLIVTAPDSSISAMNKAAHLLSEYNPPAI